MMKGRMIKQRDITEEIESLKQTLQRVRKDSLQATREGDFRKVARLTAEAAGLNKAILEAQGLMTEYRA
jgi:hypothetical protein